METITGMIIDRILDPVAIVPGIALSAALASGIGARAFEWWEEHRPRRDTRTA